MHRTSYRLDPFGWTELSQERVPAQERSGLSSAKKSVRTCLYETVVQRLGVGENEQIGLELTQDHQPYGYRFAQLRMGVIRSYGCGASIVARKRL